MAVKSMSSFPSWPTQLLYDPAAQDPVHDADDVNASIVARSPKYVAIEGMTAAGLTSVTVQAKLSTESDWHDFRNIDVTAPNALIEMPYPAPNFVRVVRVGSDPFKVYAQGDLR